MKASFVSSAILSFALACANPTGPNGGDVTVRAAPPVLELTNRSPVAVYSFIIERGAAAYTDWAPCTDPAQCAAINVGQRVSVAYAQIAGYSSGAREAIVYWWHLVPGVATGFRADSIRAVVVGL
jgi:hypothetical protein